MIGLEYICSVYQVEYKALAETMGITPQAINSWLRGLRKIPKERLNQLSAIFELTEPYFEKELSRIDKIDIQMHYHTQLNNKEFLEIEEETDEGDKYIRTIFPYDGELEMLHWERVNELLLLRLRKFLSEEIFDELHHNHNLLHEIANRLEDENNQYILKVFLDFFKFRTPKEWGVFQPHHSWSQKEVSFFEELDALMKKYNI